MLYEFPDCGHSFDVDVGSTCPCQLLGRKRSKYGAKPKQTEFGRFDSKKEMRRWHSLMLLEKNGAITGLTRNRKDCTFEMIVNEELICKYVADAIYYENGKLVVEDTKSPATMTPVYRVKKKLLKALFGIAIKEV